MTRLVNHCAAVLSLLIATTLATDIFVSTSGNDANPGSAGQPVATLQRAQQLVATAKAAGLTEDVTVHIAPGTYFQPAPLNISSADCGTAEYSVSWVGSFGPGGEPAVISAGAPTSGWALLQGFPDVFTTAAPAGTFPQAFIRQLWGDEGSGGARRPLSRSPVMIAQATGQGGAVAAPGQVTASAAALSEAELVLWHNWVSSQNKIAGYDSVTRNVSVVGTGGDPFFNAGGARYALQNVGDPTTLSPGSFFYSPSTRTLTYRALAGENPAAGTPTLIAERLASAVLFSGAEGAPVLNTHLINLTVAHSAALLEETCLSAGCAGQSGADLPYAAVMASFATGVTVEGCEVRGTGEYAVWFAQGCTACVVSFTWMHDLGAGGVRVGLPDSGMEPDPATLATNISVSDNTIEDSGHVVQAGAGVLAEQAARVYIEHNHIHHLLYTGVSTGWTWGYAATPDMGHVVGYNLIHDIFQGILSDGGCVYNLGRSPGSRIVNNVCHSVLSYGYGGWGLYTDEGSSGVEISSNVVFRTKSASFHQHYGTDNVIHNNVFAFAGSLPCGDPKEGGCDAAVRSSQHSPGSGGGGPNSSFTFSTNIVLLGSPDSWSPLPNNTAVYYTTMATGLANMTVDNNLYWAFNGPQAPPGQLTFGPTQDPMTWAGWQAYGKDTHGRVADPLFTDPGGLDFSLDPASPAFAMGFIPIDTSTVGPRVLGERQAVAERKAR